MLGLLLLLAEKVARHDRPLETINRRDAIVIGIAQALRAGAGRVALGRDADRGPLPRASTGRRPRATRSCSPCPPSCSAALFELRKIGDEGGAGVVPTAIATLLAFIVGYASIAFLLRWLSTHSTAVFVAYRVALGSLVIALTAAGAIS